MGGWRESAESAREPARLSSTLQAILHGLEDDMETIAVPIPLPSAIVRLRAVTAGETQWRGAPEDLSTREQCIRRHTSPDSVVRYHEQQNGGAEVSPRTDDAREMLRRCARCAQRSDVYFIPVLAPDVALTRLTPAFCAPCYAVLPR